MPLEVPRRPIPDTRFTLDSGAANDTSHAERLSHARLKTAPEHLANNARLSDARAKEAEDRRGVLMKRIHAIQQEAGSLYAIMRGCEGEVLRARFSADPGGGESLKVVEEDIRRFARSPDAPVALKNALALPVIDERRTAVVNALRGTLRENNLPDEQRARLERYWRRMDRANRSVTMAEAALLHAKREFLPYQRRIDELQKLIDLLDQEQKDGTKEAKSSIEALQQRRKLDSLPPLENTVVDALEKALHLYTVRGADAAWERLPLPFRSILRECLGDFEEDPETTLDLLSANLRTDYEREELRIALTRFNSLLNPSHDSSETSRHLNRRRPAAH